MSVEQRTAEELGNCCLSVTCPRGDDRQRGHDAINELVRRADAYDTLRAAALEAARAIEGAIGRCECESCEKVRKAIASLREEADTTGGTNE